MLVLEFSVQFLVLSQIGLMFQLSLLQICDFINAGPGERKSLLGFLVTVLGVQQTPVDKVDAILWLWVWWLCGESGMALVQLWSKVDCHHNTHCQQDKDSNDNGEQWQPVLWRWFLGPTYHVQELSLGLLPQRAIHSWRSLEGEWQKVGMGTCTHRGRPKQRNRERWTPKGN
jgi:hypothetical protein